MAIVKQRNKKTGVTYVYESYSYRDKETKQPRSKRKLIGRLDEETGEIVPTRKRAKNVTTAEIDHNPVDTEFTDQMATFDQLHALIQQKDATIKQLQSEIKALQEKQKQCSSELKRICEALSAE